VRQENGDDRTTRVYLCEQVITKRLEIRAEPSVLGCRPRGYQTASCKAKVETTSGAIRIGKSWRLSGLDGCPEVTRKDLSQISSINDYLTRIDSLALHGERA
jgi:hypothetical protein